MLEILTLHPTDGASVDKPFQGLWGDLEGSHAWKIAFLNEVPKWTRENLVNLDKDRGIYSLINRQRENVIETHHSSDKFNCESLELKICNSNISMIKDIFHKEALQVRYNSRMYKVKLTCGGRSMGEIWWTGWYNGWCKFYWTNVHGD